MAECGIPTRRTDWSSTCFRRGVTRRCCMPTSSPPTSRKRRCIPMTTAYGMARRKPAGWTTACGWSIFSGAPRDRGCIRRRSPRNGIMKSRRSFPRMRSCISAATIAWRIPRRSRISRCWPHSRKPIRNLSSSGGSTCSRATRRYWKLTGCLRILRRSGIPRRIGTGITD